jgi:predicted methyltransferase
MKKMQSNALLAVLLALLVMVILGDESAAWAPATYREQLDASLATEIYQDRDEWQKPEEVLEHLNLKPGDVIADIGAGSGYFTRLFAKAVSPGGKALGLEISRSRVDQMKADARRLGLDTYEARLIETDTPGLAPESVDIVFLCNTYHHLDDRVNYFKNLSGSLKKGGRVVIVDFYKKPLPVGPSSLDHKISKEKVLEEFRAAGYDLKAESDFLPYQYYLEFHITKP